MAIINSLDLAAITVFGAQVPQEGPRVIPVQFDFSLADSYTLDYGNQQNRGMISMVQNLFIDASRVDTAVRVTCDQSQQNIVVPGRTQGYYPIFAPNPVRLIVTSPGAGNLVIIHMANYPIPASQWASTFF